MAIVDKLHTDVGEGSHRRSVDGSDGGSEGSLSSSDADDRSGRSPFDSTVGGSNDEYRFSCVSEPEIRGVSDQRRNSCLSECSVELDLEAGAPEIKAHLATKVEKDCRICHMSLDTVNHEAGIPIELGCSCKNDLAAAHKQCAEAWFKIKGNKTCEICGATARNVGVNETQIMEQRNETNTARATAVTTAIAPHAENRSCCHGNRFLNFLLACMVFAFLVSWLFHFNVPH